MRRLPSFGLAALAAALSFPAIVEAECIDEIPAPQQLNVCERLLEDLVIPPVLREERMCWEDWQCLADPLCCTPGLCLSIPHCVITRTIEEVAGYVAYAGELYCDAREVSAEELLVKLAQGVYTDPAAIGTGPLVSVVNAHWAGFDCEGAPLNPTLRQLLVHIGAALPGLYSEADVRRLRLLPRSHPTAGLYLTNQNAITLDSVVIVQDHYLPVLDGWGVTLDELLLRGLSAEQADALELILHELVHVRQYREIGRDEFVRRYLVHAVTEGYWSIPAEVEAFELANRAMGLTGPRVCTAAPFSSACPPGPDRALVSRAPLFRAVIATVVL